MSTTSYNDTVDTRLVFKVYAIVAWIAGAFLYGWGGVLFRVPVAGLPPSSDWIAARIVGAVIVAVGFLAIAMVRTDDDDALRRALGWWAVGHAVALAGVALQVFVFVRPEDLGWGGAAILGWLAAVVFVFFDFWKNADGIPWGGLQPHDSVLDEIRRPTVRRLRSTYEEKIREAAGQEERHRLARDLHDSIKQQIFVMHTAAATAQARFDSDPAGSKAAIEQVRNSAREAMTEMEAMLDQLRATPLENSGLVEALKKQCDALRFRTGSDVRLVAKELPPSDTLPGGAHQALFRVAQEALANVGRHARAKQVIVTLDSTPISVQLRVNDDGVGFDLEQVQRGMGLRNMRSRVEALGGILAVSSEPGNGTLVRASVPHAPADTVDVGICRRRALLWGGLSLGAAALLLFGFSHDRDPLFFAVNGGFVLMICSQTARVTAAYLRARKASSRLAEKGGDR